ncbi:MAG: aminoglycoside phosphotransferase (APT) family kinase protein [Myxococcota bacterium]|jgi:aminoglycoside phosphotransferase (APT) family kinase protein
MVLRPQAAPPWNGPRLIDETQVRAWIAAQHPSLSALPICRLGQGWDNSTWSVGPWVLRFPRRAETAVLLAREIRWLPLLAGRLPVPVPLPEIVGASAFGSHWMFMGHRRLSGETACGVALSAAKRRVLAGDVGAFLAVLHALPVPEGLPREAHCRSDPERVLAGLSARSAGQDDSVLRFAERLRGTPPWTGEPCWIHGDLYARHLLLDPSHRLCGVIDWGDLHAGDRSVDLSIAYTMFTDTDRARFFDVYGPTDPQTRDRARLRALYCSIVLAALGQGTGDADLERVGRHGLEHARR